MIKDLKERERSSLEVLVASVSKGINTNQTPYLSLELRDASGSIAAKKWEIVPSDEETFIPGNVIYVTGDIISYRDALQMKVIEAVKLDQNKIDVTKFMKEPPVSKEVLTKRFNDFVDSINDSNCRKLLDYFINKFKDKLYDAPAARSIHHEYSSGLLMHVTSMASLADTIVNMYEDINRDLLITGILIHDFGKMIELQGPIIFKYSLEGELLGHISILIGLIKEAQKELNLDEEFITVISHLILSHHGQYEFGSPVLPRIKEAEILYLLDNIDSKIVIMNKALEDVKKGEFTQKIFALDNRTFYKPKL